MSLVTPNASKTRCLNDSPEARTNEILCKPNAGTKSPVDERFIRGYPRDEKLSLFLATDQKTVAFFSLSTIFKQRMSGNNETCRIQNPNTPRASRVGRRTAWRLGGACPAGWDADVFVRTGKNRLVPSWASKTTVPSISSKARTREILCKSLREQSPRLTSG